MKNLNWLRYSGLGIILTMNPCHWRWLPRLGRNINNEWPYYCWRDYSLSWLFLTVNIWLDDGEY